MAQSRHGEQCCRSYAWVFRRVDVTVRTHAIPFIGTLTTTKRNNQVRLELSMYFDELMCLATNTHLEISADTMHQYVVGPIALKTMMHMLSDELDRGAKSVYPNATEERVHFQQDVTIKHTDTITDYQTWHQFATIDHCKDVEDLVFP